MVTDHVMQLGVTCVRTEPAAVPPAVGIDRREQTVFLTKAVCVCFGQAVLFQQTDLVCPRKPCKAYRLVCCDAHIADRIRRERGVVPSDRRNLAVPVDRTHSRPDKAAFLSLMGSTDDAVVEHILIGLSGMKHGKRDAQLLFTEGLEPVVDEVPMLRHLAAGLVVKHHLAEHRFIQRLIVLSRQKKGGYAVLASAA